MESDRKFAERIQYVHFDELGDDADRLYELIIKGAVTSYLESDKLPKFKTIKDGTTEGAAFVTEKMKATMVQFDFLKLKRDASYTASFCFDEDSPHSNVRIFRWKGKYNEVYDIMKKIQLHLTAVSGKWFQNITIIPAAIGRYFDDYFTAMDNILADKTPRCGKIIPYVGVPSGVTCYSVCVEVGHIPWNCPNDPSLNPQVFQNKWSNQRSDAEPHAPTPQPPSVYTEEQWAAQQQQHVQAMTEKSKEISDLQQKSTLQIQRIKQLKKKSVLAATAVVNSATDRMVTRYLRRTKNHAGRLVANMEKLLHRLLANYARSLSAGIGADIPGAQSTSDAPQPAVSGAPQQQLPSERSNPSGPDFREASPKPGFSGAKPQLPTAGSHTSHQGDQVGSCRPSLNDGSPKHKQPSSTNPAEVSKPTSTTDLPIQIKEEALNVSISSAGSDETVKLPPPKSHRPPLPQPCPAPQGKSATTPTKPDTKAKEPPSGRRGKGRSGTAGKRGVKSGKGNTTNKKRKQTADSATPESEEEDPTFYLYPKDKNRRDNNPGAGGAAAFIN